MAWKSTWKTFWLCRPLPEIAQSSTMHEPSIASASQNTRTARHFGSILKQKHTCPTSVAPLSPTYKGCETARINLVRVSHKALSPRAQYLNGVTSQRQSVTHRTHYKPQITHKQLHRIQQYSMVCTSIKLTTAKCISTQFPSL